MSVADAATTTLEDRVRRLEDVEEIQRVMTRYGAFVDASYDLDGLRTVLAEDLVWTSNAFGSFEGLDAYLAGQEEIAKGVAWAFHMMIPIDVSVSSPASATGTFYLLMLGTYLDATGSEREPIVLSARYDNEFRREEEGWRCCRMQVDFHQVSRLGEGWVREQYWSR